MHVLSAWVAATALVGSSAPTLREVLPTLPNDVLPIVSGKTGHALTGTDRLALIRVDDPVHGYMELGTGDTDSFEGAQLALFKVKAKAPADAGVLVAVRAAFGDTTNQIAILRREGGTWHDVTAAVMPKLTAAMVDRRAQEKIPALKKRHQKLTDGASGTYAYKLPRIGTTIDVVTSSDSVGYDVVLWHVTFDGVAFSLAPD